MGNTVLVVEHDEEAGDDAGMARAGQRPDMINEDAEAKELDKLLKARKRADRAGRGDSE